MRSRARPVDDEASVTKRSARFMMSYIYVAKSETAKHKRAKPFKSDLSFVFPGVEAVLLFYFCLEIKDLNSQST